MQPGGYITPEDQAFMDRLLGTANESIGSGVEQQQGLARTRLAQRRIGGAAAEGVLGDIGAQGSLARARAAGAVANIGHGIYSSNQRFNQGKVMRAWDAELAAHSRYDARHQAQQAAWANAISGLAGAAGQFFGGGGGVPGTDISPPGAGYGADNNYGAELPS